MYRIDIRGDYRHISKVLLKRHTERFIPERHLRQLIHQYFDNTGFDCHPDKTTVDRIEKGFDWLGVWFDEGGGPSG